MGLESGVTRLFWSGLGALVMWALLVWTRPPASHEFTITTLARSPDTVMAGDALIRIDVPGQCR